MSEEAKKMSNYIETIPVDRYDLYGLAKEVNDVNGKQHPLVEVTLNYKLPE